MEAAFISVDSLETDTSNLRAYLGSVFFVITLQSDLLGSKECIDIYS